MEFDESSKPKILLVEDEPDVCSAIQSYFSRRGCEVSTTASGTAALSLIEEIKPDIILLDFILQDINGKDVLKSIRQKDKKIKIIVVTGELLTEPEIAEIYSYGISAYFQKPLRLSQLEKTVSDALGERIRPRAFEAEKKISPSESAVDSATFHDLSNLLGVIRNKCENFTLDIQDHIYEETTDKELVRVAVGTMNDVVKTVDRIIDVLKKAKLSKKG